MKRTLFAISIGTILLTLHGIPAGANTEASAAYNPARWSPLAPFIMQDGLTGPQSITAIDDKGNITERAEMEYDQRGRLVQETFYSADGTSRGKTVYQYEAGRPVAQKLMDARGKIISSEIREYRKDNLSSITYLNGQGETILLHSFSYSPGQISAVEKAEDNKDSISIELNGRNITRVEFRSSTGENLGNIDFKYNKDGKLVERLRTSPAGAERCRHIYDNQGRLKEYVYEIKSGDRWLLSRKLQLSYKPAS
ncbi:MAG: hypothetical protein CMF59_19665 [Leptospiraceae bacterium]|nr:hypothetical protein [Leptospiraceae bacterium]